MTHYGKEYFERPFYIAGPCSVESPEQVLKTAQVLAKNPRVKAIRGGIWKPRTRPNSFEGVGSIGLPWLKEAADEVGLPAITEVANAQHVEMALKAGIHMFWIGARTTVNPFSVQEIADALKGTNIPVFVKNPITPDVQLWVGALERILASGVEFVAAIHRGFNTYNKKVYRNEPMWELPIELKTYFPSLKIICDPSHIGGERSLIELISQRALDLNFDGLMVETHPNPESAWSDKQQQITPKEFNELSERLTLRTEGTFNAAFTSKLEELRNAIDLLDDSVVEKLFERNALVEQIGLYKKENQVTILQLERWKQILTRQLNNAEKNNLNPAFIKQLFTVIHDESIRIQTEIMQGNLNKA
ncbi:MAG: chorismate mutase [Luteibaculaceae bacterium]